MSTSRSHVGLILGTCGLVGACSDGAQDAVADTTVAPTDTTLPTDADTATSPEDTGAPPVTTPCEGESVDGRCEGSEVVYCQSIESGVARFDCAPDYECAVVDGYADCRLPGSAGCGRVTYQGYCDGDESVYCDWEVTEVVRYDCGADGMTCGFVDDEIGYYCLARPSGEGAFSVRGSFWFEKPAVTESGLGAVSELPVRKAVVQLRKVADDELVATGVTDDEGAFVVRYDDPGGDLYALAMAMVDDERHTVAVRDCPLEDCDGAGYIHAIYSENFAPAADGDIGGWVTSREGAAGAFNIFDVFRRGQDFAWEVYGVKPPPLTGQWAAGSNTSCETSCFSARDNTIFVYGPSGEGDEFDDPVLAHELGHYLESAFSRSDSPGGSHDGSPTDPRLAWGEGYGTFAGCELLGSPLYIDTSEGGASVVDISDTGMRASSSGGLTQQLSEYLVAECLWTLSRGGSGAAALGSAVIFDVLGRYFPTSRLVDRGVSGVDFVDFLDGLMCRGNAQSQTVRSVVVEQRKFPYDFGGPASCP